MRLSPRTAFLLAPFLGELTIQGVAWGRGPGVENFEEGLAGVQMMLSTLPMHGGGSSPWVLLVFPLFCVFSWELLEFTRDREPLKRLTSGKIHPRAISTGAVRRLFGLFAGTVGMLILNFFMGMAAIVLVGAIGIAFSPGETGMQTLFAAIGIAYPVPLGFVVVWGYRSISMPLIGHAG